MDVTRYRLTVTFTTPVLGSQPGRDTPSSDYIRAKAAEKTGEELPDDETLPTLEKGTTGFYRLPDDDDAPCLMAYQIKGMLKESGAVQNGARGVKNLRSKVGSYVFVGPRHLPLTIPEGGDITYNERPLRAMTMQGPRTSLARSEQLPAGTSFTCTISVINDVISEPLLRDILDYGAFQGLGQWRSGDFGKIEYTLERE